jgi:hypothetical protein
METATNPDSQHTIAASKFTNQFPKEPSPSMDLMNLDLHDLPSPRHYPKMPEQSTDGPTEDINTGEELHGSEGSKITVQFPKEPSPSMDLMNLDLHDLPSPRHYPKMPEQSTDGPTEDINTGEELHGSEGSKITVQFPKEPSRSMDLINLDLHDLPSPRHYPKMP